MMRPTFRTDRVLACAISALVAVGSVGVEAQRPFNDRDFEKMARQHPMLPDDDGAIVAAVRKSPVRNLDAGLPALDLEEWLTGVLSSYNPQAAPLEWRLERCEDFTSDYPDYSAELCVIADSANISQSEQKSFTLVLAVGGWSPSGEGRWVLRPPTIHDLFVQNDTNSLDVRTLGELTAAFDIPPDRWPTVEFELSIDASPLRALPGDTVTLKVEVRNTGKRDAPRAEVRFGGGFGESPDDSKEYSKAYLYRWFPAVPAGRAVAVELPVRLPEGRGVFHASANAFGTRKHFKDGDTSKDTVFVWVHHVLDPPGLPTVVPR